jgi:hypothetical protein
MSNDIENRGLAKAQQQVKTVLLNPMRKALDGAASSEMDLQHIIDERLHNVGIPDPTSMQSFADVSTFIGFVIGRLQSRGASIAEVHMVVETLHRISPGDEYEIMIFDARDKSACEIIRGVHARELWRWGRLLRCAVHEIYIELVSALQPKDFTGDAQNRLWDVAVKAVKVFVDLYYPLMSV